MKPENTIAGHINQCNCITCADCRGSGYVYMGFNGEYIGAFSIDDMDDMVLCESCSSGVIETCDRCISAEEDELWHDS